MTRQYPRHHFTEADKIMRVIAGLVQRIDLLEQQVNQIQNADEQRRAKLSPLFSEAALTFGVRGARRK
jgi:hypothetical protein